MKNIKFKKVLFSLIIFFSFFAVFSAKAFDGPLRVSSNNPRYFTDNSGKAIYLTGSHTWINLKDSGASDPPAMFNYSDTGGYLDFLGQHHHNFIRLWTWELTKSDCGGGLRYVNFWPWQRNGPDNALDGKPKFDFNSFNQAYFDRLRARIVAAGDQGAYVSVMLFEGYGDQFCEKGLGGSPFNGQNNINGISALPKEPYTLNNPAVTAVQEDYVRKVIDTVSDLDNVLYEIANEPDPLQSVAWQYHFIDFVKNYEIEKNYEKHPVGMTAADSTGNQAVSESSADWVSFGSYWNSSLYKIDSIPAADGEKVSILDTDHVYGMGGDRKWVWESFTRGHNPIYMDDLVSPSFSGYDANSAREAMGETRAYADKMNLASMTPSSSSADCSTTYCLRNPGNEYLVYQPAVGSFNVNLQAGDYQYEWFNPVAGSVAATGLISATGGSKAFTPPFSGDAVLWLKITGDITPPAPPSGLQIQ